MKSTTLKGLTMMLGVVFLTAFATQEASAQAIDRKAAEKEIRDKAGKQARKEAKELKKKGYDVPPGSLPLDKILEEAWIVQLQKDDDGFEKFIIAEGSAKGENKIAAKDQALNFAKLTLAGLIESRVAAITEQNIANIQNADPVSIAKSVTASKTFVAQRLGQVNVIFDVYKSESGTEESVIRIAYNAKKALQIGKEEVRKKLEEETNLLQEELDLLLDMKPKDK